MTTVAGHVITRREDLATIETPELLKFYNRKAGEQKARFHSRAKGEEMVWELIADEIESPTPGRKVNLKRVAKGRPKGRPRQDSADCQVLTYVEEHKGEWVNVEDIALSTGRTTVQVRSSLSYLRRHYAYKIDAKDSMTVKLR